MALTQYSLVSVRVQRCFDTFRECNGAAANRPANADRRMLRLANDLSILSPKEQRQYYDLVRQLGILLHMESEKIEWP